MRIVIVGAGGVGGYFGGKLAASGADVSFLARGAHLNALRRDGLRILSPNGGVHVPRVRASDDPAAIGPVDAVLFAVKLYDMEAALALLPPLIGPETIVLPFQNGVDSIDLLVRAVGRAHAGGGTAYVSAVIDAPGVIRHTGMEHLIFGEIDGARSPRLQRLLDVCRAAGVRATLSDRIDVEIWTKFVRLSVFSGMTAVTRCAIGPIVRDPDLLAMLQAAAMETAAVARAKGISLPAELVGEHATRYQTPDMKSSMLEDLERGRRLELPWLSGAVVRLGEELGVATPIHRFIATVLKPHVNGVAATQS